MVNVQFPHLILKTLYANSMVRERVTPFLSESWFRENQNISTIVSKLIEYMEKWGKFPSVIESRTMFRNDLSVLEEFDAAMEIPEEETKSDSILDDIEDFIRKKLMYDVTLKVQEYLFSRKELPPEESFSQMMSDAESFSFDMDVGFDLVDDLDKVYEEMVKSINIIPTGIHEIDNLMLGGIPDKVMIGILAPTNVGKTLMMCAMASNILAKGHNVLYITFEDSKTKIATRMMQNLCDIGQEQLRMLNKNSFVALKEKMRQMSSRHLKIVEMEEGATNTMKIKSVLKDLKEKKKFVPEIIFLDMVGCVMPNGRPNPNLNSNTIMQKVVAEWRGAICMKMGIPTVTGLQVNRGGYGSATVDLNDIADSYGSTTKLDAVFAATQDQAMLENEMYKIKVAKTRIKNNKGTEVMIGVCIEKQQIYDLNSSGQSSTGTTVSTPQSVAPTSTKKIENKDTADNAYIATAKVDLNKINEIY